MACPHRVDPAAPHRTCDASQGMCGQLDLRELSMLTVAGRTVAHTSAAPLLPLRASTCTKQLPSPTCGTTLCKL